MQIGNKGLEIIKFAEGVKLDAYKCPAGVWTIGYGHTHGVNDGMEITIELAEALLCEDVETAENEVNNLPIELNQNQFDALVSFVFNLGTGAFRDSTLRKVIINDPLDPEIKTQFLRWIHIDKKPSLGLYYRRSDEYNLYSDNAI